jgi:hypothetical protein
MNKREELIVIYADDLREKCHVKPNMELLKNVTIGCGPVQSTTLNPAPYQVIKSHN